MCVHLPLFISGVYFNSFSTYVKYSITNTHPNPIRLCCHDKLCLAQRAWSISVYRIQVKYAIYACLHVVYGGGGGPLLRRYLFPRHTHGRIVCTLGSLSEVIDERVRQARSRVRMTNGFHAHETLRRCRAQHTLIFARNVIIGNYRFARCGGLSASTQTRTANCRTNSLQSSADGIAFLLMFPLITMLLTVTLLTSNLPTTRAHTVCI